MENLQTTEKDDKRVRYYEGYVLSHEETLYFFFLTENKIFTEFEFATGNDLETSKVPLSVLFCIIEKNALIINTKIHF